jgi:hypothetical protein
MRAVAGLLGKDDTDGTRDTNPTSRMIPHLNAALAKPAADDRLIFIDLNAEATMGADGKPTWAQSSFRRLRGWMDGLSVQEDRCRDWEVSGDI